MLKIIHKDSSISPATGCVFPARDRQATVAGKPGDRDKENNSLEVLTVLASVCVCVVSGKYTQHRVKFVIPP